MDKRNVVISLLPPESIPEEVRLFFEHTPDAVCRMKGKLYIKSGLIILSCEDSDDGNELISALQHKYWSESIGIEHTQKAWYQIITSTERDRIAAIAKNDRIEEKKKRIVIVFRLKYAADQDLFRIFSDIAPMEKDDHPVLLARDIMALVKDSEFHNETEIAEYAAAVIDTMVSEGFTDLQAGIGTEAGSIFDLHRSYEEAMNAILTGTGYDKKGTLFRYSELKLQRIIDLIPAENRKKILDEYHSRCNEDAFSDEMMETVRVFFEHDLNITSASRELFIHRNTLNYRLDKIKRDTGLDLRTFQDAVIFKLIFEITEKVCQNN